MPWDLIFMILAAICFLAHAFSWPQVSKVNLPSLAWFFIVLTAIVWRY